ncbi:hypothetical protein ABTZ93_05065 [Streptomyces sp. NPDC097941]|uniref:hypothetical protein n=1 Tax=Streptomyces sp. NPDC097941 TaxID=3155685 RepID=UPI003332420B
MAYNAKYGKRHQKEREMWKGVVAQGTTPCHLCGEVIEPYRKWHLSHRWTADGSPMPSAPAHAQCNSRHAVESDYERDTRRAPTPTATVGATASPTPTPAGTPPGDGTWAWCPCPPEWARISREWV